MSDIQLINSLIVRIAIRICSLFNIAVHLKIDGRLIEIVPIKKCPKSISSDSLAQSYEHGKTKVVVHLYAVYEVGYLRTVLCFVFKDGHKAIKHYEWS